MKRTVAVVILLGLVAIVSLIAMSPWIIEGPRRLIRRLVNSVVDVPTSVR